MTISQRFFPASTIKQTKQCPTFFSIQIHISLALHDMLKCYKRITKLNHEGYEDKI